MTGDVRQTINVRQETLDRSHETGDMREETLDSRFKTGDSRCETGDISYETGDRRWGHKTSEMRYKKLSQETGNTRHETPHRRQKM